MITDAGSGDGPAPIEFAGVTERYGNRTMLNDLTFIAARLIAFQRSDLK